MRPAAAAANGREDESAELRPKDFPSQYSAALISLVRSAREAIADELVPPDCVGPAEAPSHANNGVHTFGPSQTVERP